jgi:hypothetical protein
MTVDEAKKQVGVTTDEELAGWFGVIRQSVVYWRKRGKLPEQRRLELEIARMKKPRGALA